MQRNNRKEECLSGEEVVVWERLLAREEKQEQNHSVGRRERGRTSISGSRCPDDERENEQRANLHDPREWNSEAQRVEAVWLP